MNTVTSECTYHCMHFRDMVCTRWWCLSSILGVTAAQRVYYSPFMISRSSGFSSSSLLFRIKWLAALFSPRWFRSCRLHRWSIFDQYCNWLDSHIPECYLQNSKWFSYWIPLTDPLTFSHDLAQPVVTQPARDRLGWMKASWEMLRSLDRHLANFTS